MQTHELRYFLAAARCLNFTKAAEECGITQPALTRAIKKLEGELCGELFHRRSGRVELTRLGQELQPRLEDIERKLFEVGREARALAERQSNVLRLGVMCTIGPSHIMDILRKLRERNPGVEISILDARADQVVQLLVDDKVDVGITAQPSMTDALHLQPLFTERYVLAVPAAHPLASAEQVEFSRLQGEAYLERASCEFDEHFEATNGDWPFEFTICFSSERDDWIQALVAVGQGCAIVPEHMQCLPGVVKRRLVCPEIVRSVGLITMRGRPIPAVAQSFLRLARSHKWPADP